MNDGTSPAVQAAIALADGLGPFRPVKPDGRARARTFAIGDPQATARKFFAILEENHLLGSDGWLAPDAGLVSIGDHYDFAAEPEVVAREGQRILRWLAAHPPDQVAILAGNHDLCRVMELAHARDATWPRARALGLEHEALRKKKDRSAAETAQLEAVRRAFVHEFPDVPTPGLAARDFLGFEEAQRALVQDLLVARRIRLAVPARIRAAGGASQHLLVTHASVSHADLANAGYRGPLAPEPVALALDAFLAARTDAVAPAWTRGERRALDLEPLHLAGRDFEEGGGLLYHRPVNPATASLSKTDYAARGPRRFDARELPVGLLQMCGHTQHKKCLKELEGWVAPSARGFLRGGLRTLRGAEHLVYEAGIVAVGEAERGLYFIDADMHLMPADGYPLVALEGFGP